MPPNIDATEFWITIAAMAAGFGLMGAMAWLERRPRKSFDPLPVPTTPLLLVGVLIGLLAVVHLFNLWGIHTGRAQ
jgi:membrane associated rhomboid family serine protease